MELLLVPCTVKKVWNEDPLAESTRAKDAYRYPPFAEWRRFAEQSGKPWLILSTKYGLVTPDTLIERYDVSASDAARSTAFVDRLREQAKENRLEEAVSIGVVGRRNGSMLALLIRALPELATITTLVGPQ